MRKIREQRGLYTTKDPKEYFERVLADPNMPAAFKNEAAKGLIPYVHRKMPIAIEGTDRPIPIINAKDLANMTVEELRMLHRSLAVLGGDEKDEEE